MEIDPILKTMPSKFRLRKIFRPLIKLLAEVLNRIGITPNLATCLMLLFSFCSFISLVIISNLILFSIFIFLTGIFDGIDGAIARLKNTESSLGGFFDSFMDRNSEFIIFLGLLLYCWDNILWNFIDVRLVILISFMSSLMISYFRTRAEVIFNGDFDIGLMARSERLFYIFITTLLSSFLGFLNEFLFIFMILVLITAFYRFYKIHILIKNQKD